MKALEEEVLRSIVLTLEKKEAIPLKGPKGGVKGREMLTSLPSQNIPRRLGYFGNTAGQL